MILAVIIGAVCAGVFLAIILEAAAARADLAGCPAPGRLVDIGGTRLHLIQHGLGQPVVVLDAGLGDSSQVWSTIQQKLGASTRVCSYDRAGLGWSDPQPNLRTGAQLAGELHSLLDKAGEKGPFVLVGHSSGAHTVRLFAEAYPEKVAGLVLIDPPVFEKLSAATIWVVGAARRLLMILARLGIIRRLGRASRMDLLFGGEMPPPELASCAGFLYRPDALRASLYEVRALAETVRQVNRTVVPGAWRNWPVIVLSAHRDDPRFDRVRLEQAKLARLSSRGEQIQVPGSHFIHFAHPDLVADAIEQVIRQARAGLR